MDTTLAQLLLPRTGIVSIGWSFRGHVIGKQPELSWPPTLSINGNLPWIIYVFWDEADTDIVSQVSTSQKDGQSQVGNWPKWCFSVTWGRHEPLKYWVAESRFLFQWKPPWVGSSVNCYQSQWKYMPSLYHWTRTCYPVSADMKAQT